MASDNLDVADVELLPPEVQGTWLAIPIKPKLCVRSPRVAVVENNLSNELPSSASWVLRNLTVGLLHGPEGTALHEKINDIESFIRVGSTTMWPVWRGQMFDKQFVSVLRVSSNPAHQAEMRLNVLYTKDNCVAVEDVRGRRVSPLHITVGTMVAVELSIAGMWCSSDRCGLRYTVTRLVVHDASEVPLLRAPSQASILEETI